MTQRLLFVDSDIFVLLSAAGLLHELATALGFDAASLRRLPALPHQLQRGKSFQRYDSDARTAALKNCELVSPVTERPQDNDLFERLSAVVDPGEALLLALMAENDSCLLTTGDGRALIAFGNAAELPDVRDRVQGRIVAFEVALKVLVQRLGAEEVGQRFRALPGVNVKTDIFFRHKLAFDDEQSLAEIDSYLNDLKRRVGIDLLYPA